MQKAWARVKANKGASGIDGMSIEAFPAFARQHWDRIRSALYQGSYRPAAVRRVMIAKATGGERPLGIPTVLDRLIQQATGQIIAPLFEEAFHPKSFGFRPQLGALRRYVIGWLNYFGHSRSYREVLKLDTWLRRRVRLCYWKAWKRPRPRRKRLLALGANPAEVHLATRSRKGYWRMSNNRIVQQGLSNRWLWQQGVPNMKQQWIGLHYGSPSK